jgi:hypothetical protein
VKVMPKKRVENIIQHLSLIRPQTGTIHHQIIWYSASLLLYGWFLSWIAYDILIWHKPITQVSITNYAGAIIAMALIWAGTKIFKLIKNRKGKDNTEKPSQHPKNNHKHNFNQNHNHQNTPYKTSEAANTTSATYTNPKTPKKFQTNASHAQNCSNASTKQTNNPEPKNGPSRI